jgi:transposase-like protein
VWPESLTPSRVPDGSVKLPRVLVKWVDEQPSLPYRGYRFPPEIISYCVWLYFRFSVSYRDIEELMTERGVTVTYETIRAWCYKFGQGYAKRIHARRGHLGDT